MQGQVAAHNGALPQLPGFRELLPEPGQLRCAGGPAKFDEAPRWPLEPIGAILLLPNIALIRSTLLSHKQKDSSMQTQAAWPLGLAHVNSAT